MKPAYGFWPYLRPRDLVPLLRRGKNEAAARQGLLLSWLLRAGRVADGTYITNRYKKDGVGSQLVHTINVQAFAGAFSIPYAHSPLSRVSQKSRTFPPADIPAWEKHLNLGAGHPTAEDVGLPIVRLDEYLRSQDLQESPCVLSHVSPRYYVAANPQAHAAIVAQHRASLPTKETQAQRWVEVAIHIRRGDVTSQRHPGRFTANDTMWAAIDRIRRELDRGGLQARFTVYSDGQAGDFADLQDEAIIFKFDQPPLNDFTAMQNSDILLIGKSCFSYLAGLFHLRSIVIHQGWGWGLPLGSEWLSIDEIQGGLTRLLHRRALLPLAREAELQRGPEDEAMGVNRSG